jgi:electron transfer flavoprotein beta subunit
MRILVAIKETLDTEEKIVIQKGQLVDEGAEFIMNPYDEYAVEEAIRLKEKLGGEVTVLTVGPSRAEQVLRTALAMGADQAVIVDDELAMGDEFTISKVLAAVIQRYTFDIILAGNMSVDHGASQIGPRLAEELSIAHATSVIQLDIEGAKATVTRDVEGDLETLELTLPLLVTAQQGLNEPRYPSLPGIMKAKKKPLDRLSLADLGLTQADIQAKTAVTDQFVPAKKQAGRLLTGDLHAQVKELAQLLRNESKVI